MTQQTGQTQRPFRPAPTLLALEPRAMFDAAAAATAREAEERQAATQTDASALFHDAPEGGALATRSLVVVDPRVAGGEALAAQLAPGAEMLVLDPSRDGVAQVAAALAAGAPVEALHIVTHGRDGALSLGDTLLDSTTAAARGGDLAAWREGLAAGADILLWSCEAAEGGAGTRLVGLLRDSTGADIAASTNITGAGGDFTLEHVLGTVDAALLSRAAAIAWDGALTVTAAPVIGGVSDDTGASAADAITADNTPLVRGTAAAGAEVRLYRSSDNLVLGLTTADANGDWSLSLSPFAVADGSYTVYARANDGSGLSAASDPFTLTVDVVAPIAPVVTGIAVDSGSSATDAITSQGALTLRGTAEANSTVEVFVDAASLGSVLTGADGTWSIGATLAEGSHAVTARAMDTAGNVGVLSSAFTVMVDQTAPAVPAISAVTPDTGRSATDRVTAQGSVSITGTGPANAAILLLSGGTQVGQTTTDSQGNWVVGLGGAPLSEGTHTLTARAVDAAGNESADSVAVTVVVDGTAPVAPVLSAISPSSAVLPGLLVTRHQALTLSGSAEAAAQVEVLLNGNALGSATAGADGSWSLDISTVQLPEGVANFTLRATDAAGNTGALSSAYAVTVDLTGAAPSAVTAPPSAVYGGGQAIDIAVQFSEAVAATGGTPRLVLDVGGATRHADLVSGSGTATLVFRYTVQANDADADGITVSGNIDANGATLTDLAGNSGSLSIGGLLPSFAGVTVDAVPPAVTLATPPADGVYGPAGATLDFALGFSEPVTLTGAASLALDVGGTPRQAAYLSGSGSGTLVFRYTVQPGDLDSDGVALPAALSLAPGATLRDAAGNDATLALPATPTPGLQVDAVPPAPPSLQLDAGSDSGLAADALTNIATPTLSGLAEPGATVTLLVDGSPAGTAAADPATGAWSLTLAAPLAEGAHSLAATATDARGNTSGLSAALPLAIDLTPPAAPGLALDPASYPPQATAAGQSSIATPTLSGLAEPGATITIVRDGTPQPLTAQADPATGAWSWTEPAPLPEGTYSYTATATDAAGNSSAAAAAVTLAIDLTPPAPPVLAGLDPASDTGLSSSDRITRATQPILAGTAEAQARLVISRNGVAVGEAVAGAGGSWSWTETAPLPDATYSYTAIALDAAGNSSAAAAALLVTLDTTAPAAPADLAFAPDSGIPADGLTNIATPTLSGLAEPGATVTLWRDGALLASLAADPATGAWSWAEPAPLADAAYSYAAIATDAAGNSSAAATLALRIDTTPPAAPLADAPRNADGSAAATPGVLRSATPLLSGLAEPGATLTLLADGSPAGTAAADPLTGAWSLASLALAEGTHSLVLRATDAAGNSTDAAPLTLTIDLTPPAAPSLAGFAPDSGTPGDSLTNNPSPTLSGTAEPGATITLLVDGAPTAATTTADPVTGAWSLAPAAPLADGPHSLAATATDAAGNTSAAALPLSLGIDTTAPAASLDLPPATLLQGIGATLTLSLSLSEPALVDTAGGTPRLLLDIGGVPRQAAYVSGSGSASLVFAYTVQPGDNAPAGPTVTGLDLAGGSIADAAGNPLDASALPGTLATRPIDGIAPAVSAVTAPPPALLRAGESIDITIQFSEPVTAAGGTPWLDIDIGGATRQALLAAGSGTATLLFRYTVQPGDLDSDGIALPAALSLDGATTLRDAAGNDAALALANAGSFAGVTVDAVPPAITLATPPADGVYKAGDDLIFTVTFSEPVTASGNPVLMLDIGGTPRAALLAGGSGTSALQFRYTVQPGDADADGIALSALDLSAGAVRDAAGNDTLPALQNTGPTSGVRVDGVPPQPLLLQAPAAGLYRAGQALDFTLTLSEPVVLDGTPTLALNLGGQIVQAGYLSGAGTDTLVFRYTVQPGDTDADGLGTQAQIAGGAIRDLAGNILALPLPTAGSGAVLVDTTPPAITGVQMPAAGLYRAGAALDFAVSFTEAVQLDTSGGQPSLAVQLGGMPVQALYVSGAGTDTLLFRYTVQPGDTDADGIALPGGPVLNGAVLTDLARNDADLAFGGQAAPAVLVDTTAPVVLSITGPGPGLYPAGTVLDFTLTLSEAVQLDSSGGLPALPLQLGIMTRQAEYLSGAGTDALVFRYTVQPGDLAEGGLGLGAPFLADGGSQVTDAAGNALDLLLPPAPGLSDVQVDGQPPTALQLIPPADGLYALGDTLDFTLRLSETVLASGAPVLRLQLGAATRLAALVAGSGTDTLTFRYAVQSGDMDAGGIAVLGLDLSGGGIQDLARQAQDGTLPELPPLPGLRVDGVAPGVASVAVPAAAAYRAGQSLDFILRFDEAVTLDTTGGSPVLALELGGQTVLAQFAGLDGADGLRFSYTVQPGEADADGLALAGLSLNGATLRDVAGNDASTTLRNIGDLGAVLVDTLAPQLLNPAWQAGLYGTGQAIDISLDFDAPVTVDSSGGAPVALLTLDGGMVVEAAYLSGSGTGTLVFRYVPAMGEMAANAPLLHFGADTLRGALILDAAGNAFDGSLDSPLAGIAVDTAPPGILAITTSATGWQRAGDVVTVDVTFDEALSLDLSAGLPDLLLSIGGEMVVAQWAGQADPQTLRFAYTVAPGLYAPAGGVAVPGGPQAGGALLRDAAGNPAVLDFGGQALGLVQVDSVPPAVLAILPPPDGYYRAGDTLTYTLLLSEPVLAGDPPAIGFSLDGVPRSLSFVSGLGTNTLVFAYTVQPGDFDGGTAPQLDATLQGAALPQDAAGNPLLPELPLQPAGDVRVDALPPALLAMAVEGTPAANAGSVVFTLRFSEPVGTLSPADFTLVAPGLPEAAVSAVEAGALPGEYRVTVTAGTGTGTLRLVARTSIADAAGNALPLEVVSDPPLALDTQPPRLLAMQPPADGFYGIGDTLEFTLVFSEAVQVADTLALPLSFGGGGLAQAALAGGNGTDTLRFAWVVTEGATDGASPLADLPAPGAVLDLSGNAADLGGFTLPDLAGVVVDAVAPPEPGLALEGGATDSLTADTRPTLSGDMAGAARVMLWRDGVLAATLAAEADGRWRFTEPAALADGTVLYEAVAEDAAGNRSGGAMLSVTIDGTAPAAPALAGSLPAMPLATPFLPLEGTAEAGALVQAWLEDGTLLGSAQAGATGRWSLALSLPAADGTYGLRLDATDAAGNRGPALALPGLRLDTTPPALTLAAPLVVEENAPSGTVIGRALAADASTTAFALEGTPEVLALLEIGAATGEIRLRNVAPDHERLPELAFAILATDAAGNTTRLETALRVADVNEPPQALTSLSLPADRTGALVLDPRRGVADPDAGDSLALGLEGLPSHGTVAVQPDGTLRYQAGFGYTGLDAFSYRLTDRGGLSVLVRVAVEVPFTGASPPVTVGTGGPLLPVSRPDAASVPSMPPGPPQAEEGERGTTVDFRTVRQPLTTAPGGFTPGGLAGAGMGQVQQRLAEQGGVGESPGEKPAEQRAAEAPPPRGLGGSGAPPAADAPREAAPPAEAAAEAAPPDAGMAEAAPGWTGWEEEISLAAGRFDRERNALLDMLRQVAGLPPSA